MQGRRADDTPAVRCFWGFVAKEVVCLRPQIVPTKTQARVCARNSSLMLKWTAYPQNSLCSYTRGGVQEMVDGYS
jgi:hypothetical protein